MASGSRIASLAALLTGEMGQHPTRVKAFLDSLDPAAASRLIAAADAGDTRTIRKALAEQTWGAAPARPAPRVEVTPGGRDPMSFRDRIARDPNPRRSLEEAGVATGDMSNPEVLKAYVRSVRADAPPRGRPRSAEDSIRELVKPADQVAAERVAEQFDRAAYTQMPDNPQARARALKVARESYPAEYDIAAEDLMHPELLGGLTPQYRRLLQELEKNDWLGFDYPSQAVSSVLEYGDAPIRWDMTPDLLEARDAMIFARGPGPAAAPKRPSGPPFANDAARQTDLPFGDDPNVNAMGLDESSPIGWNDAEPTRPAGVGGMPAQGTPPRRPPSDIDDLAFDEVPPRVGRPRTTPTDDAARRAAYAAAAAGAAGGAYLLSGGGGDGLTTIGNPADLADEDPLSGSSLAFSDEVLGGMSEDDLTSAVAQPAAATNDYGVEYLKLMRRLNQMNRTGAPTPDELAMQAEVRRLGDLTTRQRREGGYSFPANHPAARIRNEAMRFPIGSPERDRLNAQADAVENAVVTGRMPWDFESASQPEEIATPKESPVPKTKIGPLTESGNPADLAEDLPLILDPRTKSDEWLINEMAAVMANPGAYMDRGLDADRIRAEYARRGLGRRRPAARPAAPTPPAEATAPAAVAPSPDLSRPKTGLDLSHKSDAEILMQAAHLERFPERFEHNREAADELRRQMALRFPQARMRGQDAGVEAKLEAAATPITPDEEVGAAAPRANRSAAVAPRAAAAGEVRDGDLGAPRSTVTVDGVTVPSVLGALGRPLGDGQYYRLGDVRRAQEAAREERRLAGINDMIEGDIAKYGHYTIPDTAAIGDGPGMLTQEQYDSRIARKRAEGRQRDQVLRQREFQIANKDRPLTPYEAEQKARRDRVAARAMLAGGSQNINPQNAAAINALVALEGVDPNAMDAQQRNLMYAAPGGQGAAAVDAQSMQNAGNIISRFFTSGSVAGMMNPQAQALAIEERERAIREQAYNFAVEERNKVHTFNEAPMTREFALRLKRRVAARFGPRYADVVDGLPIEGDMAAAAPQPVPLDIPAGP